MENSNLLIFENPEFGQVRSTVIANEPWFVALDVCKALGLNQVSRAMSRLDTDEGGLLEVPHPQNPDKMIEVNAVNEAGLYHLILCSKKPEAKSFKRWITHEVIPSIRKHGAYVADSVLNQLEENPKLVSDFIQQLRAENAEAKRNRELLEQARAENAKLAPKAGYYDNFVNVDDLTCLRYTAKELGVPQNKFIGYLLEKGYAFRDRHRDGRVFAKASKRNDPLFMTRDFYLPGGEKSEYTLVTPAGKAYFKKRAEKIRAWEPGIADGEKITEEAVFAE